MVEVRYKEEKKKAQDLIKTVKAVSLTSDMWTSLHMDAYLAITCHFVDDSDKLQSILLSVGKFPERHTAANIAALKTAVMEEWDIKSKVVCLVTDGAANMLACANILEVRHSHCIAHALNLIVKKAIDLTPGLEDIRGKARKIAGHFRTSTLARGRLLCLQTQMEVPTHKLVQEVETRWNSTFDMFSRLYEQREAVGAAMLSLPTDLVALTTAEYHTIFECMNVLSPIKEATEELSAEKAVSGSKIIPLIRMLRHTISAKQRQVSDIMAVKLCTNVLQLMGEKLCHYETASQHSLSTLLDPRFKTMGFCNPTNADNAVKRLISKCATHLRDTTPDHTSPEPAVSSATESSGMNLWLILSLL